MDNLQNIVREIDFVELSIDFSIGYHCKKYPNLSEASDVGIWIKYVIEIIIRNINQYIPRDILLTYLKVLRFYSIKTNLKRFRVAI